MGNKQGIQGHLGDRTPRSPDTRARSWSFHGVSGARRKAATLPGNVGTAGAVAGKGSETASEQSNQHAGEESMRARSSSVHEAERPRRRRPLLSWDDNDLETAGGKDNRQGRRDRAVSPQPKSSQRAQGSQEDFDLSVDADVQLRHHQQSQHARPSSENRSRRSGTSASNVRRESAPARPLGWYQSTGQKDDPFKMSNADPWIKNSESKDVAPVRSGRRDDNSAEPLCRKEIFKDSESPVAAHQQGLDSTQSKKLKKEQKSKSKKKTGKASDESSSPQDIQVLQSSPKRRVSKTDTGNPGRSQKETQPESDRSLMSSPEPLASIHNSSTAKIRRSLSPSKIIRSPRFPFQRQHSLDAYLPSQDKEKVSDDPVNGSQHENQLQQQQQQQHHSRVIRKDFTKFSSPQISRKAEHDDYIKNLNDIIASPPGTRRKGKILVSRSQGLGRSSGVSSSSPSNTRAPVTTGEVITLSSSVNSKAVTSSSTAYTPASACGSEDHRPTRPNSSPITALVPSQPEATGNVPVSVTASAPSAPFTSGVVLLRRVGVSASRRSGVNNIIASTSISSSSERPSSVHELSSTVSGSPSSSHSPLSSSQLLTFLKKGPTSSSSNMSSSVRSMYAHPEPGHRKSDSHRSRQAHHRLSLDLSRLRISNKENSAINNAAPISDRKRVLSPGIQSGNAMKEQSLPTLQETAPISHSTGHVAQRPNDSAGQRALITSTTSDQFLDTLGRKKKRQEEWRVEKGKGGRHEANVTVVDIGPTTTFSSTQQPRLGSKDAAFKDAEPNQSRFLAQQTLWSQSSSSPHASKSGTFSSPNTPVLLHEDTASHSATACVPSLGGNTGAPALVSPNFAATITTTDSGYNTGKRAVFTEPHGATTASSATISSGSTTTSSPGSGSGLCGVDQHQHQLHQQVINTVGLGAISGENADVYRDHNDPNAHHFENSKTHAEFSSAVSTNSLMQSVLHQKMLANFGAGAKRALLLSGSESDSNVVGLGKNNSGLDKEWNKTKSDTGQINMPKLFNVDQLEARRKFLNDKNDIDEFEKRKLFEREEKPQAPSVFCAEGEGKADSEITGIKNLSDRKYTHIATEVRTKEIKLDDRFGTTHTYKPYISSKGEESKSFVVDSRQDEMQILSDPLLNAGNDVMSDFTKGQRQYILTSLAPSVAADNLCLPCESESLSLMKNNRRYKEKVDEVKRINIEEKGADDDKGEHVREKSVSEWRQTSEIESMLGPGDAGMSAAYFSDDCGGVRGGGGHAKEGSSSPGEIAVTVKGVGDITGTNRLDNSTVSSVAGVEGSYKHREGQHKPGHTDAGLVETNVGFYHGDARVSGDNCEQSNVDGAHHSVPVSPGASTQAMTETMTRSDFMPSRNMTAETESVDTQRIHFNARVGTEADSVTEVGTNPEQVAVASFVKDNRQSTSIASEIINANRSNNGSVSATNMPDGVFYSLDSISEPSTYCLRSTGNDGSRSIPTDVPSLNRDPKYLIHSHRAPVAETNRSQTGSEIKHIPETDQSVLPTSGEVLASAEPLLPGAEKQQPFLHNDDDHDWLLRQTAPVWEGRKTVPNQEIHLPDDASSSFQTPKQTGDREMRGSKASVKMEGKSDAYYYEEEEEAEEVNSFSCLLSGNRKDSGNTVAENVKEMWDTIHDSVDHRNKLGQDREERMPNLNPRMECNNSNSEILYGNHQDLGAIMSGMEDGSNSNEESGVKGERKKNLPETKSASDEERADDRTRSGSIARFVGGDSALLPGADSGTDRKSRDVAVHATSATLLLQNNRDPTSRPGEILASGGRETEGLDESCACDLYISRLDSDPSYTVVNQYCENCGYRRQYHNNQSQPVLNNVLCSSVESSTSGMLKKENSDICVRTNLNKNQPHSFHAFAVPNVSLINSYSGNVDNDECVSGEGSGFESLDNFDNCFSQSKKAAIALAQIFDARSNDVIEVPSTSLLLSSPSPSSMAVTARLDETSTPTDNLQPLELTCLSEDSYKKALTVVDSDKNSMTENNITEIKNCTKSKNNIPSTQTKELLIDDVRDGGEMFTIHGDTQQHEQQLQQQQQQKNSGRNVVGMHNACCEVRDSTTSGVENMGQEVGGLLPVSSSAANAGNFDTLYERGEMQSKGCTINNHGPSHAVSPALPTLSTSLISASLTEQDDGQKRRREVITAGTQATGASNYFGRSTDKLVSQGEDSTGPGGVALWSPPPPRSRCSVTSGEDSGYYGDGPPVSSYSRSGDHTRTCSSSTAISTEFPSPERRSDLDGRKKQSENVDLISKTYNFEYNQGLQSQTFLDYSPQALCFEGGGYASSTSSVVNSGTCPSAPSVFRESTRNDKFYTKARPADTESSSRNRGNLTNELLHNYSRAGFSRRGEDTNSTSKLSIIAHRFASPDSSAKTSADKDQKLEKSTHVPVAKFVASGESLSVARATIATHVRTHSNASDPASVANTTVNITTSPALPNRSENNNRPQVLEVTNPNYETDSLDRKDSASKLREVAKKLLAGHAALSGRLTSTLNRQHKKEQQQQQQQQQKKKKQKNHHQAKKASLTLFTPLGKFGKKKTSSATVRSAALTTPATSGTAKGLSRELSGSEGSLGDLSRRRGTASQYRDLSLSENSVVDAVNNDDDDEDEWFFFPGNTKDKQIGARRVLPFEPSEDFAANVKSIYSQGEKSMYSEDEKSNSLSKTDLSYPLDVARSYAVGGFEDPAASDLSLLSPDESRTSIDFNGPTQDEPSIGNVDNNTVKSTMVGNGATKDEKKRLSDVKESKEENIDNDDIDFASVEMRPRTNSATAIELSSRTTGRIAMGMASARIRRSYASPVKETYLLPVRPHSHSLVMAAGVGDGYQKSRSDNREITGPSADQHHRSTITSPNMSRRQVLQLSSPVQSHEKVSQAAGNSHLNQGISDHGIDRLHSVSASYRSSSPGQKLLASRALRSASPAGRMGSQESLRGRGFMSPPPTRQLSRTSSSLSPRSGSAERNRSNDNRLDFELDNVEDGPRSLVETQGSRVGVPELRQSRSVDIPSSGVGRPDNDHTNYLTAHAISPLQRDLGASLSEDMDIPELHSSRNWNTPRQRHSLDSGQRYLSQSAEFSHQFYSRPFFHGSAHFQPARTNYLHHRRESDPSQRLRFPGADRVSDRDGDYDLESTLMSESFSGYPAPDAVPSRAMPISFPGPQLQALSPMSRASISLAPLLEERHSLVHGDSLTDLRYSSSGSLPLSSSLPSEGGFPHRRYQVVPNYPAHPGRSFGGHNAWPGEQRRWYAHAQANYPLSSAHFPTPSSHLRHQRSSSVHSIPSFENRYSHQPTGLAMYSYDDSFRSGRYDYANYNHQFDLGPLVNFSSYPGNVNLGQDVWGRRLSIVSGPDMEMAARLSGLPAGRCLNPSDRAWSYSMTSLAESTSGRGLLFDGSLEPTLATRFSYHCQLEALTLVVVAIIMAQPVCGPLVSWAFNNHLP
ncbi:hypothetical protein PoB_001682900 [Plakobranchus ocellatus]|uniref:Uncharacterized protein n=1 Tax=Plakobranchus ocellatus TaxID=259542 RepID=A0AAV3Z8T1_9GAST|nr:hypothetical protein PoB_001682900 [Plakobranchus ocellatus]